MRDCSAKEETAKRWADYKEITRFLSVDHPCLYILHTQLAPIYLVTHSDDVIVGVVWLVLSFSKLVDRTL